jgi:hypothetical protein
MQFIPYVSGTLVLSYYPKHNLLYGFYTTELGYSGNFLVNDNNLADDRLLRHMMSLEPDIHGHYSCTVEASISCKGYTHHDEQNIRIWRMKMDFYAGNELIVDFMALSQEELRSSEVAKAVAAPDGHLPRGEN